MGALLAKESMKCKYVYSRLRTYSKVWLKREREKKFTSIRNRWGGGEL